MPFQLFSLDDIRDAFIKLVVVAVAPLTAKLLNDYYNWLHLGAISYLDLSIAIVVGAVFLHAYGKTRQSVGYGATLLLLEYLVITSALAFFWITSKVDNLYAYIDSPTLLIVVDEGLENKVSKNLDAVIRIGGAEFAVELDVRKESVTDTYIENAAFKNGFIKALVYIHQNGDQLDVMSRIPLVEQYFRFKIYELDTDIAFSHYEKKMHRSVQRGNQHVSIGGGFDVARFNFQIDGGSVDMSPGFNETSSSLHNKKENLNSYRLSILGGSDGELEENLNIVSYLAGGAYLDFIGYGDKYCEYVLRSVDLLGGEAFNFNKLPPEYIEKLASCYISDSRYDDLVPLYLSVSDKYRENVKWVIDQKLSSINLEELGKLRPVLEKEQAFFADSIEFIKVITNCGGLWEENYITANGNLDVARYETKLACLAKGTSEMGDAYRNNHDFIDGLVYYVSYMDTGTFSVYRYAGLIPSHVGYIGNIGGDVKEYCSETLEYTLLFDAQRQFGRSSLDLEKDGIGPIKDLAAKILAKSEQVINSIGCPGDLDSIIEDALQQLVSGELDFVLEFLVEIDKTEDIEDADLNLSPDQITRIGDYLKKLRSNFDYNVDHFRVQELLAEKDYLGVMTEMVSPFISDVMSDEEKEKFVGDMLDLLALLRLEGTEYESKAKYIKQYLARVFSQASDKSIDPVVVFAVEKVLTLMDLLDEVSDYSDVYPNFYIGRVSDIGKLSRGKRWDDMKRSAQEALLVYEDDPVFEHFLAFANEKLGKLAIARSLYQRLEGKADTEIRTDYYRYKLAGYEPKATQNMCMVINEHVITREVIDDLRNYYAVDNTQDPDVDFLWLGISSLVQVLSYEGYVSTDYLANYSDTDYQGFVGTDPQNTAARLDGILVYLSDRYLQYAYNQFIGAKRSGSIKPPETGRLAYLVRKIVKISDDDDHDIEINDTCFSKDEKAVLTSFFNI